MTLTVPGCTTPRPDLARNAIPAMRRIVLKDHVRLPGRFFGRLTATAQAAL